MNPATSFGPELNNLSKTYYYYNGGSGGVNNSKNVHNIEAV
jgi:hypothetical protein